MQFVLLEHYIQPSRTEWHEVHELSEAIKNPKEHSLQAVELSQVIQPSITETQ